MMATAPHGEPPDRAAEAIGEQADRKARSRAEGRHGVLFGLGMFGLVGWAIALPTLIGIALGIWLDRTLPLGFSWTLTLLFAGVALGCWNAWFWIRQEGRHE